MPDEIIPVTGSESESALSSIVDSILNPAPPDFQIPAELALEGPDAKTKQKGDKTPKLRIGSQEYDVAEVARLVKIGQGVDGNREQYDAAMQMYEVFASMTPDQQSSILDHVQGLQEGKVTPGQQIQRVAFDAPKDYQRVATNQMSDEAATVAEMLVGLDRKMDWFIRQTTAALQAFQATLGQQQRVSLDESLARKYGITVQAIRDLREDGVEDVAKFLAARFNPAAVKNKPKDDEEPPPGAPGANLPKSYDDTDPRYSDPMLQVELYAKGIYPKDKKARNLLHEHMGHPELIEA